MDSFRCPSGKEHLGKKWTTLPFMLRRRRRFWVAEPGMATRKTRLGPGREGYPLKGACAAKTRATSGGGAGKVGGSKKGEQRTSCTDCQIRSASEGEKEGGKQLMGRSLAECGGGKELNERKTSERVRRDSSGLEKTQSLRIELGLETPSNGLLAGTLPHAEIAKYHSWQG